MSVVEVYGRVGDTDSDSGERWQLTMNMDIPNVREINAFTPEETPAKHVVAFVTNMSGVHLCEFTGQYKLGGKRWKGDVMIRLDIIKENLEPEQNHSVSASWESTDKLAICYEDCSVAVYMEAKNTKYIMEHSIKWNADFKQKDNPKLSIDWPRPAKLS